MSVPTGDTGLSICSSKLTTIQIVVIKLWFSHILATKVKEISGAPRREPLHIQLQIRFEKVYG